MRLSYFLSHAQIKRGVPKDKRPGGILPFRLFSFCFRPSQLTQCTRTARTNHKLAEMTAVSLATVWVAYLHYLATWPFVTKGITGAVLKTFAVLISQKIRGVAAIDWIQVRQYAAFAAFFDTPICQPWYSMGGLATLTSLTPINLLPQPLDVLAKAALDQLTFGVFYTAVFFIVHGLIGGKSLEDAVKNMRVQIWPCTRASFAYWIPATWLGLSMRDELQIPTFNCCGVVWTIIQSLIAKKLEEAEMARRANTRWHVAAAVLRVPGMTLSHR